MARIALVVAGGSEWSRPLPFVAVGILGVLARWQNFSIWRGRLPHWRADGVEYYVTFRHRRELSEEEMGVLFARLLGAQGKKLDFRMLCVLPEQTEMLFTVETDGRGEAYELSDVVEKAKKKAGAAIIKKSGERWPPFYGESYDRIIRDEAEFEETWMRILSLPVEAGLCEDPDDYRLIFVPEKLGTLSDL